MVEGSIIGSPVKTSSGRTTHGSPEQPRCLLFDKLCTRLHFGSGPQKLNILLASPLRSVNDHTHQLKKNMRRRLAEIVFKFYGVWQAALSGKALRFQEGTNNPLPCID